MKVEWCVSVSVLGGGSGVEGFFLIDFESS